MFVISSDHLSRFKNIIINEKFEFIELDFETDSALEFFYSFNILLWTDFLQMIKTSIKMKPRNMCIDNIRDALSNIHNVHFQQCIHWLYLQILMSTQFIRIRRSFINFCGNLLQLASYFIYSYKVFGLRVDLDQDELLGCFWTSPLCRKRISLHNSFDTFVLNRRIGTL